MPDFVEVSGTGEVIGIIKCADCGAAWKQTDEFVRACPKCSSVSLDELEAILSPKDGRTYIVVAPPESHLI